MAKKDPRYHLKAIASETKDILDELQTTYQEPVSIATFVFYLIFVVVLSLPNNSFIDEIAPLYVIN